MRAIAGGINDRVRVEVSLGGEKGEVGVAVECAEGRKGKCCVNR